MGAEVRKALAASGANVLDAELPVAAADDAFAVDGSLVDPLLRMRLRALLDGLAREAGLRSRVPRRVRVRA